MTDRTEIVKLAKKVISANTKSIRTTGLKLDCVDFATAVIEMARELEQYSKLPDNEAWRAAVAAAHLVPGGNGALLVQQITTHYNAMRDQLTKAQRLLNDALFWIRPEIILRARLAALDKEAKRK